MKRSIATELTSAQLALLTIYLARPEWVTLTAGGQRNRQQRDAMWYAAYRLPGVEVKVARDRGEPETCARWAAGDIPCLPR